jgi:hypothetical protein
MGDDCPFETRVKVKYIRHELIRAIAMAKARCIPCDELLEMLRADPVGMIGEHPEYIFRLTEECIQHGASEKIVEIIQLLIEQTETIPSTEKQRYDRYLYKMLSVLDTDTAIPIALRMVQHKRKHRRQIALGILNQNEIGCSAIDLLLHQYRLNPDQGFIVSIARSKWAGMLKAEDLFFLLEECSDEYWRTRIIEHLFEKDLGGVIDEIVCDHPMESIRAIGRMRKKEFAHYVIRYARQHMEHPHNIGLAIWALGKVGEEKELEEIEHRICR